MSAIFALGRSRTLETLEMGNGIAHCILRDLMIKTLYVRSSDADRCTESFRASIPITVTGIDGADEYASYTGIVTSLEYAPMPTEHENRQWSVMVRA